MKLLLITPPMTQLNTPYPATAYLTGFLRSRGIQAEQRDFSIELALKVFSHKGLRAIRSELLLARKPSRSDSVSFFLKNADAYLRVIDSVVRFLQSKDPTLALRISSPGFLPEGPRFNVLDELESVSGDSADPLFHSFGSLGTLDRAKFFASLFIDDVADVVRDGIDSRFEFSKYGEKLAASAKSFEPLRKALESRKPTLIDRWLDELTRDALIAHRPDAVLLTAPFPGNIYGAFRIAREIKSCSETIDTVLGGGYANTELRELCEPKVFDYFDYVTLDDGERPLLCLIDHWLERRPKETLLRTFYRDGRTVRFATNPLEHDIPQALTGNPTYEGLKLDQYLSLFEFLNPMHRIWSDGRWNKLTLAHGCYWRKCTFCDTSLDYIKRYDSSPVDKTIERIESLIRETGQTGFHFVDEAAPPAILKSLAERLIERNINITWWGNVRFDKTFTPELAQLLARSGCVAVSGGLEVASNRLLKVINKGVSVEQVARVTRALTDAGIMVHAYLIYGYATQTVQETVDSLEMVRQLFQNGCIQSAHWHRFSVTAHSEIGKNPKAYGLTLSKTKKKPFARNDIPFTDSTRIDHDRLGVGLKRALYNYMHGVGLDEPAHKWFDVQVPKSTIAPDFIETALSLEVQSLRPTLHSSRNDLEEVVIR